ncbi:MAG: hypothetical protein HZA32_19835 [Opitutae bacterium]|nr:hypothetical protein [Opitutae bacterium]
MLHRIAAFLLVVSLATVASAQLIVGQRIGVDINTTSPDGNNGTATNWTSINTFGGSETGLELTTGNSTSVSATLTTNGSGGFNTLGDYAAGNGITSAPASVTSDGAWGTATGTNTLTLTFSGLDNSLIYSLEIFSVAHGLSFFLDSDTPSINGVATVWSTGFESRGVRYYQTTGAIFADLTTDGAGNLSFAISDAINRNAILNGAILTATPSAVPEPSTYAAALAAVALCVTAIRRRRATAAPTT